ncbi:MAG: type 1 glutamine amidotransferase domain-containing protein [Pseudobdellovibrionaceae bacterium]
MKKVIQFLVLTSVLLLNNLSWASAQDSNSRKIAKPKSILVILSSERQLELKNSNTYLTGYYLNELIVPVRKLIDNKFEIIFATPKGNIPSPDEHSLSKTYFDNDQVKFEEYKTFHDNLLSHAKFHKLSDFDSSKLDQIAGLFIPGGHAPMQDLLKDPDLRRILQYFHSHKKPTGLICHGPISLLAGMTKTEQFLSSMEAANADKAKLYAKDWIYKGYQMAVFSTDEEKVAEKNQLNGHVKFYPDQALSLAGAIIKNQTSWKSNSVRDRELITGQNPYSDFEFINLYLKALSENSN